MQYIITVSLTLTGHGCPDVLLSDSETAAVLSTKTTYKITGLSTSFYCCIVITEFAQLA